MTENQGSQEENPIGVQKGNYKKMKLTFKGENFHIFLIRPEDPEYFPKRPDSNLKACRLFKELEKIYNSKTYSYSGNFNCETFKMNNILFCCYEIMIEEGCLTEIQQDILYKHLSPHWKDDVQIVINSVGGEIAEGSALIAMMKHVRMDVKTVAVGEVCSMGACILAAGTVGKRLADVDATIMVHGFYTDFMGGTRDQILSQLKWVEQEYRREINFWIQHSAFETEKEVKEYLLNGKDVYLTASEAVEYGIIDNILKPAKKQKKIRKRRKKSS